MKPITSYSMYSQNVNSTPSARRARSQEEDTKQTKTKIIDAQAGEQADGSKKTEENEKPREPEKTQENASGAASGAASGTASGTRPMTEAEIQKWIQDIGEKQKGLDKNSAEYKRLDKELAVALAALEKCWWSEPVE